MSLDKVNEGFEGDEKTLAKEKAASLEEGRDGDGGGHQGSFRFSLRTLWLFTGPGWLMSIAYLDPGNIESDLQSGVVGGYRLLWITMWASVLGFIMQRLSARLGMVTGKHLAELCHENLHPVPNFILWIMVEIAIIGSDMQEVIGTSIAIYLLSDQKVKLYWGCIITMLDTFTFLFLDSYGRRKLEFFFAFLIMSMAVSFGINYFVDVPDQAAVARGTVVPWLGNNDALMQGVAAVGAIIMPHNLYLHSGLVSKTKLDRTSAAKVREANFYTSLESFISIAISFIINLFVISVFANAMHEKTYTEVFETCEKAGWYPEEFDCDNDDNTVFPCDWADNVEGNLYIGGLYLGCSFGIYCTYVWAVGILASGQSSTMTGTYSGQFAMQGFLNLQWAQWKILLVTRFVAMIPTALVLFWTDMQTATFLNDILNTVMSIMLPFAIMPTLCFTSSPFVMGEFANGLFNKIAVCVLSLIVICINIVFVVQWVGEYIPSEWYYLLPISLAAVFYFGFIAYLLVYLLICIGFTSIASYPLVKKYYRVDNVGKVGITHNS